LQNLNNAQILTYLTKRSTMPPYPAAPTELTVRRLSVDLSQGFSRHWNGGDAFLTAYANALSMSFPVGEQSFIDAVKAGAKQLPDTPENAELKEIAKGFVGQEATHRHLHALYNAHLEKQGLVNHWGPRAEQRLKKGRDEFFSKSDKGYLHELAITAAFEHYTSIFGDQTLSKPCGVGMRRKSPNTNAWPLTCTSAWAETTPGACAGFGS
jgi:predicted metal-dependent hydrolase